MKSAVTNAPEEKQTSPGSSQADLKSLVKVNLMANKTSEVEIFKLISNQLVPKRKLEEPDPCSADEGSPQQHA